MDGDQAVNVGSVQGCPRYFLALDGDEADSLQAVQDVLHAAAAESGPFGDRNLIAGEIFALLIAGQFC